MESSGYITGAIKLDVNYFQLSILLLEKNQPQLIVFKPYLASQTDGVNHVGMTRFDVQTWKLLG
jgi:hypothetical protein